MSLIVIHSSRFADHQTPPGHPECPERAHVMDLVADEWRRQGGEVVAPRSVTTEQLIRVHDEAHLRRIEGTAGVSTAFDADTYSSPETIEIAHLAAGAAVEAVERVLGGSTTRALALVRPPGHHAERDQVMGFCFYNNAAVAAAHARALGVPRVAIVDFDVHHGNGTEQIFEADPSVLYLSTHQHPFYPGTGDASDIGSGEGRGFTVNVPIEAGAADADYACVFRDVVVPVLTSFEPGLLVVSAGFDAHERDPLAGMQLTAVAFAAMMNELRRVADDTCGGRLVALTEGGYDLEALYESLRHVLGALAPAATPAADWGTARHAPAKGEAAVARVREALAGRWSI